MCWNDFPDWRPTLDYIIDELNSMLKHEHPPPHSPVPTAAPTLEEPDDVDTAPTMTLP